MSRLIDTRKLFFLFSLLMLTLTMNAFAGVDTDGDGIDDFSDNCSQTANPAQIDADGDGFGNRCDADLDNNLIVNFLDVSIFSTRFLTSDPVADFDSSGAVNFLDFTLVSMQFLGPPGPGPVTPSVTYTADVQPILFAKCAPCHTGLGIGGHDIGITYLDALLPADNSDCDGLNVGQCALVRIQNGEMPQGAGCTGDPAMDAGNADCLTAAEQATIQSWIDSGLPE